VRAAMRFNGILNVGDILYRVDPKILSVNVFRINNVDEKQQEPTTHENFVMEKKESRLIPMLIEKFPFEFKGLLYFLTEDDANHYIKTQIGM
jgi:hypothetical protein